MHFYKITIKKESSPACLLGEGSPREREKRMGGRAWIESREGSDAGIDWLRFKSWSTRPNSKAPMRW